MSEQNTPVLGLLIDPSSNPHRDAIHIAIAPVTSDEILQPGQRVALVEGTSDKVKASSSNTVGIVDPYLRVPVPPGRKFWLCLYCRTVTSLRHEWTHPAFPEEKSDSELWLMDYAKEVLGVSYQDLMEGAKRWILQGEYYNEGDKFEGVELNPEFWTHYENVRGGSVHPDKKENFFSCAC